jgi:8-oxo-dGTP diphosphatase
MGNRWEFPGGKVDAGENETDSIVREMKEEFGVAAVVGAKITESDFVHNEKKSLLKAYLVELEHDGIEKPFVLTEHTEYKWVCIDEIPSYEFVDSDLKIYPKVKEFLSSLK